MGKMEYRVIIERDEDGIYVGRTSDLAGCAT
ncbi:MAG: type II toxin-antitoxin system HicB family antitoxin [Candidatus Parvarchaeum sp.]